MRFLVMWATVLGCVLAVVVMFFGLTMLSLVAERRFGEPWGVFTFMAVLVVAATAAVAWTMTEENW